MGEGVGRVTGVGIRCGESRDGREREWTLVSGYISGMRQDLGPGRLPAVYGGDPS